MVEIQIENSASRSEKSWGGEVLEKELTSYNKLLPAKAF